MTDNNSDATLSNTPNETRRTASYRDVYANQTLVTFTGTDVQVWLATSTYIDNKPINELHATLYLAPAQAKFLGHLLLKTVGVIEKAIGQDSFVIPPGLANALKDAEK